MLIQRLILSRAARAWRKAPGASVPTVCVGNITVGGTGKTPHTELILRLLQESDRWGNSNLAVLSRGYKRKSKGFQIVKRDSTAAFAGDEPLQMARKFPAVTVAVDKNRVEGCERLASGADGSDGRQPIDIIVLDDAFQHKKLHASLNIVLVNYSRPLDTDRLLPFGRLRDLPSRIADADIVIVTKCPSVLEEGEREAWRERLEESAGGEGFLDGVPILFTTVEYCEPVPVFPEADTRYNYSKTALLFSGIADDTPLRAHLSDTYKIVGAMKFPDHHAYSRGDIGQVAAAVHKHPTAALLTTEKDAVRVLDCKSVPAEIRGRLFAVPVRAAFLDEADRQVLQQRLDRL
ncbi:MAG: tetraacyldisaccharide 4'-kinase [Bacteroidales bacterium]|nr:tetraacyldisaccharide 4'-kinase [Bacteroidales bacterium]